MIKYRICRNRDELKNMIIENYIDRYNKLPIEAAMILKSAQLWKSLKEKDAKFFDKHEYLYIEYDSTYNKYSVCKRGKGRPESVQKKIEKITLRFTVDEKRYIDEYCNKIGVTYSKLFDDALASYFSLIKEK